MYETKENEIDKNHGFCSPRIDPQIGLNVLIEHFLLGKNWHVVMPLTAKQINTEAVYYILEKNQKIQCLKGLLLKGERYEK